MIIGQLLNDRYKVIRKIGAGSYGDVYLVSDEGDGARELVVKMSSSKEANNHTEARLMMTLDHPNIVKAYDFFVINEDIYVIMRFFRNGTILNYIEQTRDASVYVEKWSAQLLSAVNYLHRQKVLHRDIKLENLFLDDNFNLILGDFGISRELNLSLAKTFIGTPEHMSPEMFNNKEYSTKSDMWAVGCCFYHMMERSFPFQGTLPVIMQAVEKVEYRPMTRDDFPKLRDLIRKMLVYDPEERIDSYNAALELEEAFDSFAVPEALPLEPETVVEEDKQQNALICTEAAQEIISFQYAAQNNAIAKQIMDFFLKVSPSEECAYNMILAYYFMAQDVSLKDICQLVKINHARLHIPDIDWVQHTYESYLDTERFMEALFFEMSGLSSVDTLVKLAKQLVMIAMFESSEE